ncbi:MAG: PIN/TRAM domain-containing protein [Terriglobia bacterium]
MLVSLLRLIFVLAAIIIASFLFEIVDDAGFVSEQFDVLVVIGFLTVGGGLGFVLGGVLGRPLAVAIRRVESLLQRMPAADLVFGNIGLVFGLALAYLIFPLFREVGPAGIFLAVLFFFVSGSLGFQVFRARTSSFEQMLGNIGKGPRSNEYHTTDKVLDTSIIIDGRIAALCRAGFVEGDLKIPRFVLKELQLIADSKDGGKRERARTGMNALNDLQKEFPGRIRVIEDDFGDETEVDQKLLKLAQEKGDILVTVDYNLQKVAEVQGERVLNVNELAAALKPPYFPGESIKLKVIKEGKEPGQGVGYLEDGTMVVVEKGQDRVGRDVEAQVGSVLQTNTGKMVFAKLKQ